MTLSLYSLSTVIVMVHSIVLLLIFGAVVPCCICAPSVRGNYTELFRGYDLKQRIAYRIGQVECLKSLQEKRCSVGPWEPPSWKLQQRCIKICPQATHSISSWAIELSENSPQLRT